METNKETIINEFAILSHVTILSKGAFCTRASLVLSKIPANTA